MPSAASPPIQPPGPDPSATGRRLGAAVLAYLAATTLFLTWAPFHFAAPGGGFRFLWSPSDMDVAANAGGALAGAWLFRRMGPRMRVGGTTLSALALDLPLTGLALLLVPLLWLAGAAAGGGERVWLMILPGVVGGILLGSVHGTHIRPAGAGGHRGLTLAAGGGFLVAALPGAATRPDVLAAGAVAAVVGARLRSGSVARARAAGGERRTEVPTLKRVLPLVALYLVLAALWPLDLPSGGWRGGWSLAPAARGMDRLLLLRALEHLAAFTVVGYMAAEYDGRRNAPFRGQGVGLLLGMGALASVLEVARGWSPTHGASGSTAILAVAAGVFGGWLYHLQRDHVRTILAAERILPGAEAAPHPPPSPCS